MYKTAVIILNKLGNKSMDLMSNKVNKQKS